MLIQVTALLKGTFSVVVAAYGARSAEAVGQQEDRSLELLHSHHGLHQVLEVHVCHLGRFGASDCIMVLHLQTHTKR